MLLQTRPVSHIPSTHGTEITSLEALAPLAAGGDPRALCFRQHGAGPAAGPSLGSSADGSLGEHQDQLREAITHQSSSPTRL